MTTPPIVLEMPTPTPLNNAAQIYCVPVVLPVGAR